ncbi:hypothetical protein DPMN_123129 [Dreissena polymorpha]|uniref:Uncharacterized protein n=1 Tax=Dreissena polymorpha TaxID=45954 RepID=A0A9D4CH13_DREPO|nr:hypothetical protein DPMN_050581 [Dreissena polymorpha]KAH3821365.1 hypothetical protein DPMN_123129 [Dreissena polymorpha]
MCYILNVKYHNVIQSRENDGCQIAADENKKQENCGKNCFPDIPDDGNECNNIADDPRDPNKA